MKGLAGKELSFFSTVNCFTPLLCYPITIIYEMNVSMQFMQMYISLVHGRNMLIVTDMTPSERCDLAIIVNSCFKILNLQKWSRLEKVYQ